MRGPPPFPASTPFLEADDRTPAARPGRPDRPASTPSRITQPIRRWFQQVAAVNVPEFEDEYLTGDVDGTNTVFGIPTATPTPTSSLSIVNETTGATIPKTAYYLIPGQRVQFYAAPTGGPLFASYRY